MSANLDMHDIQGNIVFGYGKFGYPVARYLFFKFIDGRQAREFLLKLVPLVTTSAPLQAQKSQNGGADKAARVTVTTNVAFTYDGLKQLELPDQSLRSFPEDFRMGMKARRAILGDDGPSDPANWDPIWNSGGVHMYMSINAVSSDGLESRFQEIRALVEASQGAVEILSGHRGADGRQDLEYQSGGALKIDGKPTAKEHFHYTDGISDPFFQGQSKNPEDVIGAGKPTGADPATLAGWEPLETGEFLLGHRDEAYEYPIAPQPRLLSYNGSFMVYRKLHENVGKFNDYIEMVGRDYGPAAADDRERKESLKAKFAGRWSNGAPLATCPTYQDALQFGEQWDGAINTLLFDPEASDQEKAEARKVYEELKIKRRGFDYNQDLEGARCPVGAHTRRVNPRGALQFGTEIAFETPGALVNRRRILRRGLPYGDSSDRSSNDGDHGIIFMAINCSIERQFEFVQQQWINYGNDFKLSNEKDALLGNHGTTADGTPNGRVAINGDAATKRAPFLCGAVPRFVETRGGDYFFIPSMTALRMIGEGIIDPT